MTLILAFLFKVFAWFTQRNMDASSQWSTPGHYDIGKKAKAQDKSPREELGSLGCYYSEGQKLNQPPSPVVTSQVMELAVGNQLSPVANG